MSLLLGPSNSFKASCQELSTEPKPKRFRGFRKSTKKVCGSCQKSFKSNKNFEKHIADCEFDTIRALSTEKWKSAKRVCGSCQKNFRFGIHFENHIAECGQFDIIGTLITEKSLTGENLSRQIFSYLDISSLFRVQMVSKTWRYHLVPGMFYKQQYTVIFSEKISNKTSPSLFNQPLVTKATLKF